MATIIVERSTTVPMRDGTRLSADVYRPAGPGRWPVLLQRTPYDKDGDGSLTILNPFHAVEAGYAVVIQDCRGRYASAGVFDPFQQERADGFDSVEWCGAQPWSTGDVGMYGMSYVGATQWLAALEAPPSLRAILPIMTADDFHDGWVYQGGAFCAGFTLGWAAEILAPGEIQRANLAPGERAEEEKRLGEALARFRSTLSHWPLADEPRIATSRWAPYLGTWFRHPARDAFWERVRIAEQHHHVTVPALNVGGWYDLFVAGAARNFAGMRAHAATGPARSESRLLMGPWTHSFPTTGRAGDRNFGTAAALSLERLHFDWFDRWLLESERPGTPAPPVRFFVMNDGWRDDETWPPAGAIETPYFLDSGGRANGLTGDGVLSRDEPGESSPPDRYLYNPATPVPRAGNGGVADHRRIEERLDVLLYTTPPLTDPIVVAGPVSVRLWVASSAPATDFVARLIDVAPDGYATNVCEGILRVHARGSMAEPALLEPDQSCEIAIDLTVTANLFRRGHRIRLEVTSSCFPQFDRNANTGEVPAFATRWQPAVQTVFHDASRRSRVILPVLAGG